MRRVLNEPALASRMTAARARARAALHVGRERRQRPARLRGGDREAPGSPVTAPLRIGVDARELLGDTTGVGRYLGELLRRWTARADAAARRFVLYAPEPLPLPLPPGMRRGPRRRPGAAARGGSRRICAARSAPIPLDVFFAAGLHRAARRAACRSP